MEPHLNGTRYWRCLNCGQVYFGDCPPDDLCPFCNDLTTWTQHVHGADSSSVPQPSHNGLPTSPEADASPSEEEQLPLFHDEQ